MTRYLLIAIALASTATASYGSTKPQRPPQAPVYVPVCKPGYFITPKCDLVRREPRGMGPRK